jgi:hypothetical protein
MRAKQSKEGRALCGPGHRRDDLADQSLRVWSVYSCLIGYRPEQSPIQIVRIVGGYQDIPHLFAPE